MAWFMVDDQVYAHPKFVALTPRAQALWLRCGAYSMAHLTDGLIGWAVVRMLGGTKGDVNALVAAGLWEVTGRDEWVFHDWLVYQRPAEQIRAERDDKHQARVAAGRAGGKAKAANRASKSTADTKQTASKPPSKPPSKPLAKGVANAYQTPSPTPTTNSVQEAKASFTLSEAASKPPSKNPTFADFWAGFPKRGDDSEMSAARAWTEATKHATPAEIMAGLTRYAADPNLPEPQWRPGAKRWLEEHRWTNGPLPPRRGNGPQPSNAEAVYLAEKARLQAQYPPPRQAQIGGAS